MMKTRLLAAAALAASTPGCQAESPAPKAAEAAPATAPSGLPLVPLKIVSGSRSHDFTVEVAATADEQSRGLMFRETLAPNAGMVFPFRVPRPASFWMMNTLIPLDMIFIRADGTIARIAANTVPHSLEPVGVGEPVAAVLEIAGGRAAALGIKEGDVVTWSAPRAGG